MTGFIDTIKQRIADDKNVIIINTGQTGSGKSFVALELGEVLNPGTFGIHRVVFNAEAFMELLNSKTLKKGDVIIFDEAGVGIPAKEWYEISNRLFNYVLQTFRHDNLIVIFTTPSIGFIDGDSRKLIHYIIETKRIDKVVNQNICRIYEVQHNARLNKNYYKILKFKGVHVNPIRFNKPSEQLIKPYLQKKREFTEELNKNAEVLIKKNKEKKLDKKVNVKEVLTEIKNKLDFYSKERLNGNYVVDANLIHGHYDYKGLTFRQALFIKKSLEAELNG